MLLQNITGPAQPSKPLGNPLNTTNTQTVFPQRQQAAIDCPVTGQIIEPAHSFGFIQTAGRKDRERNKWDFPFLEAASSPVTISPVTCNSF